MNTEAGLPFQGVTSQSRHASHQGAVTAEPRALPQTLRLLQLLHARYPDGYTDAEIATVMEIERSTVNARRGELVKADLVEPYGHRTRVSTDTPNTIWRLKLPARAR